MLNFTQKIKFFSIHVKKHQRTMENMAFGIGVGTYIYHYPHMMEKLIKHQISLSEKGLSEEEKLAVKQDPEKNRAFISECKEEIREGFKYD